jgi:hypothetical protein
VTALPACFALLQIATGLPVGQMRIDEELGEVRVWDRGGRPLALSACRGDGCAEAEAILWRLSTKLGPIRAVRRSCATGG